MSKFELQMRAKGLTQAAFAEKLGVKPNTVSLWMRGKTEPHPSLYPPMSELLEINVYELIEFFREKRQAAVA